MKKKKTPDKDDNIFNKQTNKSTIFTVKTSLKSILKDYYYNFPIINDIVKDMNEIAIISYLFIKLYFLHLYKNNKPFPKLNRRNITYFIKACGIKDNRGKKSNNDIDFKNELDDFYEKEFKHLLNGKEKFNLTNKCFLIEYLSVQMATCYNNNIKEHFITRIRRFMNITKPEINSLKEQQKLKISEIKKQEEIELHNINDKVQIKLINDKYKKLINEINSYYNGLWNNTKNSILLNKLDKVPNEYKEYALWIKNDFLPSNCSQNYGYDVKTHPEKYIIYTLKMNDYIENNTDKKLFQSLSLRNSIIPSYITIDCSTLIYYFFQGQKNKLISDIKNNKDYIWNKVFKTHKKVMNVKDYHIDTIQTDGIGCSITFTHNKYEKFVKKENRAEDYIGLINNDYDINKYINDLNDEELEIAKNKKIISCDPGKHNLIYMLDENHNKLRYTGIQRRFESNKKRNSIVLEREKIKNKIIQEETKLSKYNCKTNDINKFSNYIKEKIKLNDKLKFFYENELIRKMKWRSYICNRRSEDNLLNSIEKKFGKKEDILISYGNWNNSQQMKHIIPSLGIGMRKIINKKFNCVLFDEFRTSKLCSHSYYENNTVKYCCNELKNYKINEKEMHRILICSNCKSNGCESKNVAFINRDINACQNILNLSVEWIEYKTRNNAFTRKTLDDDTLNKTTRKRKSVKTHTST
jgi:hypothetical protein